MSEVSDPHGSRAWGQRIGKEMVAALGHHKQVRTGDIHRTRCRNPITHMELDYAAYSSRPSSSGSTAPSLSSSSREMVSRIEQLEETLVRERQQKRVVESELEDLKLLCKSKYRIAEQ
eukprot:TRINITY_DN2763_c0_g1_i1.p3 TRINITY_DN2763_c0_g1~~TRINITY_DN2763_c0_g1_i1.p3  ORF type:complete len:118 (+),score=43.77 TRINITY_DN2763_c0_g1_i1:46-399(+)